ncbi:hypothetical protein GCM10028793_44060 [Nocardiopsis oceani]
MMPKNREGMKRTKIMAAEERTIRYGVEIVDTTLKAQVGLSIIRWDYDNEGIAGPAGEAG